MTETFVVIVLKNGLGQPLETALVKPTWMPIHSIRTRIRIGLSFPPFPAAPLLQWHCTFSILIIIIQSILGCMHGCPNAWQMVDGKWHDITANSGVYCTKLTRCYWPLCTISSCTSDVTVVTKNNCMDRLLPTFWGKQRTQSQPRVHVREKQHSLLLSLFSYSYSCSPSHWIFAFS